METFLPERVAPVTLAEGIVAGLRRAIILGELPAGLHLEEPALATKFGVSRIPVREALARLAHAGLVRLEPRRGAFVVGLNADDISDVYEFRLMLELAALPRAIERLTEQQLVRMQEAVAAMQMAVRSHQLPLIGAPDVAFHQQLIEANGNRRLLAAWHQIVGLVETLLTVTDTLYRDMPAAVESHQTILDAIQAHDVATARTLLCSHLEHGATIMREAIGAAHGHSTATSAGDQAVPRPGRADRGASRVVRPVGLNGPR